jgi:hypothetical protein
LSHNKVRYGRSNVSCLCFYPRSRRALRVYFVVLVVVLIVVLVVVRIDVSHIKAF